MNHRAGLAALLRAHNLDALFLTSSENRFYAAGFASSDGYVLVTREGTRLFVDARYYEAALAKNTGCPVSLVSRSNVGDVLQATLKAARVERLGFEDDVMSVAQWTRWSSVFSAALIPASPALWALRLQKDAEEIMRLEAAQRLSESAYKKLLPWIRPGRTEREIAARLVYEMLSEGAQGLAFDPIVVSGENSALPHGVPTDRAIGPGDCLTLDFGVTLDGYCSDTTRTVFIGPPGEEMIRVYETVLQAQLAGLRAAKAGVTGRDIDGAARSLIEAAGYGPYFGHSFGHGLGLAVHEPGGASSNDTTPLPAGSVLSAEPGIYLPGRFGVRIEDVVVLEEDGAYNLTRLPKSLTVLPV